MRFLRAFALVLLCLGAVTFRAQAGDDANPGDIVINEFIANPSGSDSDREWIELHNTTGSDINIDGWTLSDSSNSNTLDNGGSLIVPANGKIVICREMDSGLNGGVTCNAEFSRPLTNSGDSIILEDDGAIPEEIARIDFSSDLVNDGRSAYYLASSGVSDFYADNGDLNQWGVTAADDNNQYGDGDYGTPGAINNQTGESGAPTAVSLTTLSATASSVFPPLGVGLLLLLTGLVWWKRP